MKRKITMLLAAITCLNVGCSSDDNNDSSGINGRWHVVKIQSAWTSSDYSFDKGTITWAFRDEGTVKVVNDAVLPAEAGVHSGPPSGTYDYTVGAWDSICDEALTIDDDNYGCLWHQGDTLKVSTSPVDGPMYFLVR